MPTGLTGRVLFWAAVAVALVAVVFAVLADAVQDLRGETSGRQRAQQFVAAADRVQKSILDLETGVRAFMITRQEEFLEPWEQARGRLPAESERLVALASGGGARSASLARQIRRQASAYLDQHSIPLVSAIRSGDLSASDAPREVAEGKRLVDRLRDRFADLRALELRNVNARDAAADRAGSRALSAGLIGFALILAVTGAGVAYLARTVTRPVSRVAAAAACLGRGEINEDLEERARTSGAAREIVSLTATFAEMARIVQERGRRLERENVSLERRVRERTVELEEARYEALLMLALAAEFRDDDTHLHTQRVGRNAALIASEMGMDPASVDLMRSAAPLHDIGKIGISDTIMLKPGRLTAEEFDEMKRHVEIGVTILGSSHAPLFHVAAEIARTHHERWDGSGYPGGLQAGDIPLAGRIVALVDVFDALTHARSYKEPWPLERAVQEIRRSAGSHFDPAVVAAFDRIDPGALLADPAGATSQFTAA